MKKTIYILVLSLFSSVSYAQDSTDQTIKTNSSNFEGKVTYVHQILNPNKLLISDEDFYNDMPNGGKSTVTLYLKGNQYRWEYSDRTEVYIPNKNQIAIQSKRKKDSIYYAYGNIADEPLESIKKSELTKKLLGYDLSAYQVKTKWESRIFFYSTEALKTEASYWRNHKYNYLGDFISRSSCFPMIIHQKSMLGNWILAVSKIEPMPIKDTVFKLEQSSLSESPGLSESED